MDPSASLKQTFNGTFASFSGSASGVGTVWKTTLPHNLRTIAGNGEQEYYSDPSVGTDPFSTSGGVLSITASRSTNPAGLPFTSGVITTEKSFAQLYGYFQITAELPVGQGLWPAFWLLPASLHGTQEIEAMEAFGFNSNQYSIAIHAPSTGIEGAAYNDGNLSKHFNTYGVYWTPTTISFWFDGKQVAVAPTPADMNTPMFMLADLAVSSAAGAATSGGTLKISNISAYAYDPSVAAPPAPLHVVVPAGVSGAERSVISLTGISVADTQLSATKTVSVTVSDKALGILTVAPTAGVTITENSNWAITFHGALSAVNSALATLTYHNVPTTIGTAPTADTLTVAASDTADNLDSERVAITLSPAGSPNFVNVGPGAQTVTANGNDVFVLNSGAIAAPGRTGTGGDQILAFHTAASGGATSDFLALHGFATNAQLLFVRDASVHGTIDPSMQYYRVSDSNGGSPSFLVQMANHGTAHLAAADFGFYPT